ncbi:hypothetical protein BBK36DRAFT_1113342 [Trichoderma citrinoviride]|uniref:Uncharacterized protein n=1 Tax=Trichoderma citrinoviride TaxID=58853 RepID=A0A2T4BHL7_9HYPO|nr:hypothetical protein BBK36DRAFT_1113342 [Trichoderma citrinoviride]PTB68813.1 hypothetical protein BBK36DRAFT_1113342 [Trichoderma citrinoviride]
MFHSKGFRISSQPSPLPPPLFYTPKPPSSWHSDVLQSIRRLFITMCCGGSRTAYKTSDAAVRILEEGKNKIEEDCEPLIEGGVGEERKEQKKLEVLRVTFPRHAAASFLKTGTSRGMREANWVL